MPLIGTIEIENESIGIDDFLYLSCGQSKLPIRIHKGSRVLIIGGEPFQEDISYSVEFCSASKEEIIKATEAWNNHTDFGEVEGYQGNRLIPPELPCGDKLAPERLAKHIDNT